MSDTAVLEIVNPIATPQAESEGAERYAPAPRLGTLDAKRVALYWNGKQNGLHALDRTKEVFAERFDGIEFVELTGDLGGTNRYLSEEQLDQLVETVDAVVATTADCGSCCSWLMRDLCELERRGLPAIGYTAAIFEEDARFSVKTFGVPEACPLIVAECFSNKTVEEIHQMVDDAMDEIVECLTVDRTVFDELPQFDLMVLCDEPSLRFEGSDLLDAFQAMQQRFITNGWSDGMPLIPPTPAAVDAMVAASGRQPEEVVGLFAPGFGVGTVEKIAANAVMAGCRPEVMPIVMAAME